MRSYSSDRFCVGENSSRDCRTRRPRARRIAGDAIRVAPCVTKRVSSALILGLNTSRNAIRERYIEFAFITLIARSRTTITVEGGGGGGHTRVIRRKRRGIRTGRECARARRALPRVDDKREPPCDGRSSFLAGPPPRSEVRIPVSGRGKLPHANL